MRTRTYNEQRISFTNQLVLVKLGLAVAGTIIALLFILLMLGRTGQSQSQTTTFMDGVKWEMSHQENNESTALVTARTGKYFTPIPSMIR